MNWLFQIGIILFAITGLIVSAYLHHKKKTSVKDMACPMDGSCEKVVSSEYAKFLGIPVELMGISYYILIILSYFFFLLGPATPDWFVFFVLVSSIGAVLFSAYLTFIQAFALKMWCTLCLASAALCALIMIFAIPASTAGLAELMIQYEVLLHLGLLFGAAVGLGSAVIGDFFLLKFIQDFEISEQQAESIRTLYHMSWFGLSFVVVSGTGLYLGESELLLGRDALATSLVALGVLIVNNSFLNLYVTPRLQDISFFEAGGELSQKTVFARKAAFSMSLISIISWLALFILVVHEPDIGWDIALALYGTGVVLAFFGGLLIDLFEDVRANEMF